MIPINYHHLYYFWITAKTGCIGAASRELYLAQPTLSLQLKQLERFLGNRLFDRSRKGVKLTPEGRITFDYCERIFAQGTELVSALQPGQALKPAVLRLGVTGSISCYVILQIFNHIWELNPQVRINIYRGPSDNLRERLEKHNLDIVVSSTDFSSQMGWEFRSRLAGTIPIYFVATPGLKAMIKRFPAHLSKIPMLLMAAENPVRKDVDIFFCRRKIAVSVAAEIDDTGLIQFLALQGLGAATIDALSVKENLKSQRLIKLHRNDVNIKQNVWFVCGRHPKPNPILRQIIRSLMEQFNIQN